MPAPGIKRATMNGSCVLNLNLKIGVASFIGIAIPLFTETVSVLKSKSAVFQIVY